MPFGIRGGHSFRPTICFCDHNPCSGPVLSILNQVQILGLQQKKASVIKSVMSRCTYLEQDLALKLFRTWEVF
jgi:hypothetical protein